MNQVSTRCFKAILLFHILTDNIDAVGNRCLDIEKRCVASHECCSTQCFGIGLEGKCSPKSCKYKRHIDVLCCHISWAIIYNYKLGNIISKNILAYMLLKSNY